MRFIPVYTGNSGFLSDPAIRAAVYPCVYRELSTAQFSFPQIRGLSLCIQGTLLYGEWLVPHSRFIPVYTGNSNWLLGRAALTTVYPCVYRELLAIRFLRSEIAGLSLCIQGTLRYYPAAAISLRFIPVYTGNSICRRVADFCPAVYPCVYRELLLDLYLNPHIQRFIPVYTGNSVPTQIISILLPVYPCVYRELLFVL